MVETELRVWCTLFISLYSSLPLSLQVYLHNHSQFAVAMLVPVEAIAPKSSLHSKATWRIIWGEGPLPVLLLSLEPKAAAISAHAAGAAGHSQQPAIAPIGATAVAPPIGAAAATFAPAMVADPGEHLAATKRPIVQGYPKRAPPQTACEPVAVPERQAQGAAGHMGAGCLGQQAGGADDVGGVDLMAGSDTDVGGEDCPPDPKRRKAQQSQGAGSSEPAAAAGPVSEQLLSGLAQLSPPFRSMARPLHCLAEAIRRITEARAAGSPTLGTDRQCTLAVAVEVCFGPGMLDEPQAAEMLGVQGRQHGGGGGAASLYPPSTLPLLIGSVSALPVEDVAGVMQGAGGLDERETRARLLAWAIGAAGSEAPPRPLSVADVRFIMTDAGPQLEARGLGDPIPALQAAFQQVQKQGRALVVVASCLAHAQQGRVGDEEGNAETRVIGQLMRVLGRAMGAEGGGGFSALTAATRAMQSSGAGGGLSEAAAFTFPDLSTMPFAQPLLAHAYGAITEAIPLLEGQAGELRGALTGPALSIGVTLHSSGGVDLKKLSKGISQALVLAYNPAWRLPLQAAVAAVAESMAPGGPGVELVMQLMGEMKSIIPADAV